MTASPATVEIAAPAQFSTTADEAARAETGVEGPVATPSGTTPAGTTAGDTTSAGATAPQAPGRESAFAITSFVLGVASIVAGWTFIAPAVGLVFGVLALRRRTTERVLALWGVWLNVAMLALSALAIAAVVLFAGVALVAGLPMFIG